MRNTAKGSLKAGLIAGGGALTGGLVLGPLGAMIGGIVGSIVGYMKGNPYDGAVQAVTELPATQRDALLTEVRTAGTCLFPLPFPSVLLPCLNCP